MKKTFRRILLISLTALASVFLFAGCSFGVTKDALKDKYGLSPCVTYYANGEMASFTPGSGIREKNVYFPTGVQPYEYTAESIKYDKYIFDGWYEVELDEEGNPITLKEFSDKTSGKTHYTYQLGDKVDFSKITLQENDHLYFAAGWIADTSVYVKLVHDGDRETKIPLDVEKETSESSPVYQKEYVCYGDTVKISNYSRSGELATIASDFLHVKDNAYTFLEYYADEECTTPVTWPLVKQNTDVTIYAKYIEGDWIIVNTAKEVKDMFGATGKTKHYWINADIDCSSVEVQAKVNFACEIQGNGHTLSGLTVTRSSGAVTTSMFGTVQETAKIENLTLTGLQLNFTFKPGTYSTYFVFTEMQAGAVIHNVTLQGNMNIYNSDDTVFLNLDNGNRTNCLYGGYETDAAYEAANENGFKFTQAPTIVTGLKTQI